MPTWGWIGGVLLLTCAIFFIWRLVQLTKQPRRFFRAGLADPQRERFTTENQGALAPQTVEEPGSLRATESTLDEEAATLIEGERHHATPLSTNVDREAQHTIEEVERSTADPDEVVHRGKSDSSQLPSRDSATSETEAEQRHHAAEEHRKAAEEHRRAAETLDKEDAVQPGSEQGDGSPPPKRRVKDHRHEH